MHLAPKRMRHNELFVLIETRRFKYFPKNFFQISVHEESISTRNRHDLGHERVNGEKNSKTALMNDMIIWLIKRAKIFKCG